MLRTGVDRPEIAPLLIAASLAASVLGGLCGRNRGLLLRYTRTGLELKAVGSNPARRFFMVSASPFMLWPCCCGRFAGLAGNLQVTAVYHRLIPAISSNYGYLRCWW